MPEMVTMNIFTRMIGTVLLATLLAIPSGAGFATLAVDVHPQSDLSDATIIPLGLPTPDFYTAEMHAKVAAAGQKGLAYDIDRDVEVELAMQFLFIRPGAWMLSPSWCTMNFIYGSSGDHSIGTAGHCAKKNQAVTLVVYPGVLANIGTVSHSVDQGIGKDWALVRIASNWQQYVDTNTAVIFGPEGGAWTGPSPWPVAQPVKHFGHGVGVGTTGTPRAGVMMWATPTTFFMNSVAAPGDSGSPVLLAGPAVLPVGNTDNPTGEAVGILTHLVIIGSGGTIVAGTRVTEVPMGVADGDLNPLP